MSLHCGYERHTDEALRQLLGDGFFGQEIAAVTLRPWIEVPGAHGTLEHRPLERVAVVIEGDVGVVAEVLGDGFRERLDRFTAAPTRRGRG